MCIIVWNVYYCRDAACHVCQIEYIRHWKPAIKYYLSEILTQSSNYISTVVYSRFIRIPSMFHPRFIRISFAFHPYFIHISFAFYPYFIRHTRHAASLQIYFPNIKSRIGIASSTPFTKPRNGNESNKPNGGMMDLPTHPPNREAVMHS